METNPGIQLQKMGVEVDPADSRSAQEILNQINRKRNALNIEMEPNLDIREKMAEFALRTYPLPSDKV